MVKKIRMIDKDGEPIYGEGVSNYFNDNDAITMDIVTRLKSIVGDCFFDLEANMDWDNIIGSKNYSKERIDEDVKKVILDTEDVSNIISFNSYLKDRVYYANIKILTDNASTLNIKFNNEGVLDND